MTLEGSASSPVNRVDIVARFWSHSRIHNRTLAHRPEPVRQQPGRLRCPTSIARIRPSKYRLSMRTRGARARRVGSRRADDGSSARPVIQPTSCRGLIAVRRVAVADRRLVGVSELLVNDDERESASCRELLRLRVDRRAAVQVLGVGVCTDDAQPEHARTPKPPCTCRGFEPRQLEQSLLDF